MLTTTIMSLYDKCIDDKEKPQHSPSDAPTLKNQARAFCWLYFYKWRLLEWNVGNSGGGGGGDTSLDNSRSPPCASHSQQLGILVIKINCHFGVPSSHRSTGISSNLYYLPRLCKSKLYFICMSLFLHACPASTQWLMENSKRLDILRILLHMYVLPSSSNEAELWDLDNMGKVDQSGMGSMCILDHNLKGVMTTPDDFLTLCWLILCLILTF